MTPASRARISVIVTAAAATLAVAGCGGDDPAAEAPATSTGPPPATTTTAPPTPPTPSLPGVDPSDVALVAGYPGWTELTKPPLPELRSLATAHPGDKRVWASPPAAQIAFPYPPKTVIVKEARTGADLTLLAIMEKVRANDAATGGWRYVEYTRAAADAPFTKVGFPESGCAGCHQSANTTQKTDWVFTTLP